jgi:hypothetical protein
MFAARMRSGYCQDRGGFELEETKNVESYASSGFHRHPVH